MALRKDLTIIYDEDAEQWAESFEEQLRNYGQDAESCVTCEICSIGTILPIPDKNIMGQLKASKGILIILSEKLLDFLVKHKGAHMTDCIPDPGKGILFFLNVSEDDIRDHNLQERFKDYNSESWCKMSYDNSSTGQDFFVCLDKICEVVTRNADSVCKEPPPDSPYMRMGGSNVTVSGPPEEEYTTPDGVARPSGEEPQDNYDITEFPVRGDTYEVKASELKRPQRPCAKKQYECSAVPSVVQCEV